MPQHSAVPTRPAMAVFDTETTGFKPAQGARLLEIGVVRLDASGNEEARWTTLVNPGDGVGLGAEHIHGITRAHLAGAPQFADVIGDFVSVVRGAVLVAHNSPFDVAFLESEFRLAGYTWPKPVVADTLSAARFLLPGLASYKLGDLADRFDIVFEGAAHSALADAAVTARVYRELLALTSGIAWPDVTGIDWPDVAPSGRVQVR